MGKYDDLNSVLLEGRLVKDPTIKTFSSENSVCNFTIANNYSYKQKDGTYKQDASFVDIQVWGKSGVLCNQYLGKGSIVRLRGRISQDKWEDENKKTRSKIYVTAGHVEFRQCVPKSNDFEELAGKADMKGKSENNAGKIKSAESVARMDPKIFDGLSKGCEGLEEPSVDTNLI
jgi:single stranded DNA-binding protein